MKGYRFYRDFGALSGGSHRNCFTGILGNRVIIFRNSYNMARQDAPFDMWEFCQRLSKKTHGSFDEDSCAKRERPTPGFSLVVK